MQLLRYIAVLVGRVVDKSEKKVSDAEKVNVIRDASSMIEYLPDGNFSDEKAFPILGFLISCSLSAIDGNEAPEIRITASMLLLKLVKRAATNILFIESIAPNSISRLLKLFILWEKEPKQLLLNALDGLGLLLIGGVGRIIKDKKMDIIVGNLCRIGIKLRKDGQLASTFEKVIFDCIIMDSFADCYDNLQPLLSTWTSIIAFSSSKQVNKRLQAHPTLVRIALERLNHLVYDLPYPINLKEPHRTESLLEEIYGLVFATSPHLWPDLTMMENYLDTIIDLLLKKMVTREDLSLLRMEDFDGLGDNLGRTIRQLCSILGPSHLLKETLPLSASQLLSLSYRIQENDIISLLEISLEAFDNFIGRDLSTSSDIYYSSLEEVAWYMCWAYLIKTLIQKELNQNYVPFMLKSLLFLKGSPSFPVREAAEHVLSTLASSLNFKHLDKVTSSFGDMLLDLIARDMRFPLLFPSAPRQLSYLLKVVAPPTFKAANFLSILRDIEDLISSFQNNSAYMQTLLDLFLVILEVVQGKETPVPRRKEEKKETVEPILSAEQTLATIMIHCAIHFLTDDNLTVRLTALKVLESAIGPFTVGSTKNANDALFPLIHQTWQPLLARLHDHHFDVVMSALRVVEYQTQMAGDFMRDRVQKQLLGSSLSNLMRRNDIPCHKTLPIILSTFKNVSRRYGDGRLVREMARMIVQQVVAGTIAIDQAHNLLLSLIEIDGDQLFYFLVGQIGKYKKITKAGLRSIDLKPYKLSLSNDIESSKFSDTVVKIIQELNWEKNLQI